jgi:hypothetical protein
MILLHRISSVAAGVLVALGFCAIFFDWLNPIFAIVLTMVLLSLVLSRLIGGSVKTFQFWHLLGTPALFVLSGFGAMLLLESAAIKIVLAVLVTALLVLFVEHVFSYIHLPVNYQPFTLEYLSQLLHILSIFFISTLGFGMSLFLHTPLWLLSPIFFCILLFIVYGTLWAGKIEAARARPYAFAGAVLTTEMFMALSFLPTGFYSNAAFLALGAYVFLGLSRAHALHKLSTEVLKRYSILFFVLTLIIAATSQWI